MRRKVFSEKAMCESIGGASRSWMACWLAGGQQAPLTRQQSTMPISRLTCASQSLVEWTKQLGMRSTEASPFRQMWSTFQATFLLSPKSQRGRYEIGQVRM